MAKRGARPVIVGPLLESIVEMRDKDAMGWGAIANEIAEMGIPPLRGEMKWYPATVRVAYLRAKGESYR